MVEYEGELIGWLSLGNFYDGGPAYQATAEVGVYIKEGHKGKGICRTLIEEVVKRASESDIETLTAGAFAQNEPSVELFESFGFEKWARFPEVAEIDGSKKDLVVLGLKVIGEV